MQHSLTQRLNEIPIGLAALGVAFAAICFGIVPYFARGLTEAGLAPQAVAFFRFAITALVLAPVLVRVRAQWRALLWGGAAGAAMGLGWIGYVSAVRVVPASTVGVIYMTYPVFTVLVAWVLFGDRATRRAVIAGGLILLAAIIAGNPTSVGPDLWPALFLSLGAPLGFGFGIAVLVHRLADLPPLARLACVPTGSVLALLPFVIATPLSAVWPPDAGIWLLVIGLALGTALVPQLIYSICSPLIGASRTAVIGSLELPTMFAVSVLILGETLTIAQVAACVLILAAIILTRTRASRNVATTMSHRQ